MSHTRSSLFSDEVLDQVARDSADTRAIAKAFEAEYAAQLARLTTEATLDALATHGRSLLPLARDAAALAGAPAPVAAALAVLEAMVSKLTP